MSTNYFLKTGKKRKIFTNNGFEKEIDEELHIGVSAKGWHFALHILGDDPEDFYFLRELKDWDTLIKSLDSYIIIDENGKTYTWDQMKKIIVGTKNKLKSLNENDFNIHSKYDKIGCDGNYVLVTGYFR